MGWTWVFGDIANALSYSFSHLKTPYERYMLLFKPFFIASECILTDIAEGLVTSIFEYSSLWLFTFLGPNLLVSEIRSMKYKTFPVSVYKMCLKHWTKWSLSFLQMPSSYDLISKRF